MKTLVNLVLFALIVLTLVACGETIKQTDSTRPAGQAERAIVTPTPKLKSVISLPTVTENAALMTDTLALPSLGDDIQLEPESQAADADFTPDIVYETYNSVQMGVTFRHPEDWHVIGDGGRQITVSPSINPNKVFQAGAGTIISAFPKNAGMTIERLFEEVQQKVDESKQVIITQPQQIEIGGKQGFSITVEGQFPRIEMDKRDLYIVVDNDPVFVVFQGYTPPSEVAYYQPFLEAIAFSAEFSQPTAEFLAQDFTGAELLIEKIGTIPYEGYYATYSNQYKGLSFLFPPDWYLSEKTDNQILIAPNAKIEKLYQEGEGMIVSLFIKEEGWTVETFLNDLTKSQPESITISEPVTMEIAGKQTYRVSVEGAIPAMHVEKKAQYFLVDNDPVIVLFQGYALPENAEYYQPWFEAIVFSAEFSEPDYFILYKLSKAAQK